MELNDSLGEEQSDKSLSMMLESTNIAEKLDKEKLYKIGDEAEHGYVQDKHSRKDWEASCEEWLKLAKQTVEPKSFPWQNAANVKYPLLSTAAMQFAARAYPSLVPSDGRVVKARKIGKDVDGKKTRIAEAVSIYMSYQLLNEMENWEEHMDKLLIMLPILGIVFKKTYWDPISEKNCSHLVLPQNLVVNYWAKDLKSAERVSEILYVSPRKFKEKTQSKLWLDVEVGDPKPELLDTPFDGRTAPDNIGDTNPHIFIEQHTYLDLDDDGYKEPYIVTFHKDSKQVVRITARFDKNTVFFNDDGDVKRIDPVEYYTKFSFIPNPDGSFYDIGFGILLGPINESVNTIINQLIDAGTLSNLQNGWIGKGLRMRMGSQSFTPGEWKVVNATGDDIKKQIFPMPVREPSNVLFQLLGTLITSGKELASVAEIFVGKMPGQNTPATTTMATIEQGMKVFTAVYKRIYRSLAEEFSKLYRLNSIYLNPQTYVDVVDMEVGPDDFDEETNQIFPGADPTAVSQTEKLLKAQGLMELLPSGILDPVKVVQRVLEAQEQPNWEELLHPQVQQTGQMPPPPPDPKVEEMKMKGQLEQQSAAVKNQALQQKMELESRSKEQQMAQAAQEHNQNMQQKEQAATIDAATQVHKQRIFSAQAEADQIQKMAHKQVEHTQKVQNMKKEQAAKPKPKGNTK